ncbi:unnamed protein product, partial [Rotaria sordida]
TISTATGCFSSDTLVTLINLQQIPIEKLRIGDELLTIDGTKIVSTEMIMMLDQNQHSSDLKFINDISIHIVISSITFEDDRMKTSSTTLDLITWLRKDRDTK